MVGDGSYLMMAQEIVTSIQEGLKLIIVLLDSQGYASIGGAVALARIAEASARGTVSICDEAFRRRCRSTWPRTPRRSAPIVHRADRPRQRSMPRCSRRAPADRTTVIYVAVDPLQGVPGYESWWDVPVAEVSEQPAVQAARTPGKTIVADRADRSPASLSYS